MSLRKVLLAALMAVVVGGFVTALIVFAPSPGTTSTLAQDADPSPDGNSADDDSEEEALPAGTLGDDALVFTVPFERGDGSLAFSRQGDLLRVDCDIRLPYSGGDGQRNKGSSVNLTLSVDGAHGRHLMYFPSPLWVPDGQGNFSAYRIEASWNKDGVARLGTEASFGGEADFSHWAKWTATMWIDLRYVLVPGNTPTSLADNWYVGVVMGNEAATVAFPSGLDMYNPSKTPKQMLAIKVSELPEREELEDDPREKAKDWEDEIHDAMKGVEAELLSRDQPGAFEKLLEAKKSYPEQLWPAYLTYLLSNVAEQQGLEDIDKEYMKFQKDYVEACPGQSNAHLDYLDNLLRKDRHSDATTHAKKVFASPLCTERAATLGYMQMEWASRLSNWGYIDEADEILKSLAENEELLKRDEFRLSYKFALASLAEHQGDSAAAAEIYQDMMVNEQEHLGAQQLMRVQQLSQFQKQAKEQWETEVELRKADAEKQNPRLVVETDKGKIVIELFEDDAPNTVASMVKLANDEFYNGLNFHRIEPAFVAQGGCPNGNGTGSPGYRLKFEDNDRAHFRGSVAMARSESKDSAGCQFYICLSNGPNVVNLTGSYCVIGRVIEGMEVADMLRVGDKIKTMKAENLRDHEYKPNTLPE